MQNGYTPKVLIIDDEKGLRIGTQRLLESEGYEVSTAENGTTGVKLCVENDFDIALIDLKMPDMDGIEVLAEIKKAKPNTICFIATAYASYDTAIESTRLGAYGYIPKPFTPDELLYNLKKGFTQRLLILESEELKKERERSLLEIANERSRLNTIIQAITDGVLVINRLGEVVYSNNAALKYLNIEDVKIGKMILNKLPQKVNELVNKYLSNDEVIHKSYTTQIEILPNELFIEAITSPVSNPDESLAGVVLVIRNITNIKKVEQIKNQFVSMVAHELKTPVAAVLGFLKIILDKNLNVSEEQKDDFISRSVVRLKSLLDLVNDLLDISRLELKTKQREIESLNIDEILRSTVQLLEIEANKRNLSIVINIEDNLPNLKADHGEITRIFTNIISNAVKYNKENGTIKIDTHANGNYLITRISDTGIGLREEEKANMFQEFYRAKNEHTRGISGTGLGLTIVKQIVDSYHGKIEFESEYERGTTFTIYLPINKNN
ncbi:MAG: response regulator [Melioribacteraceae bacterium]|nr:response regulator [Melioribacteraceae bacterium]WKZ68039.1 MAG: response regulator [Melioribacteraceae bacterium]